MGDLVGGISYLASRSCTWAIYEGGRSEGLRINLEHLGFSNAHAVTSHGTRPFFFFFSFGLHRNAAAVTGIRSRDLGICSRAPKPLIRAYGRVGLARSWNSAMPHKQRNRQRNAPPCSVVSSSRCPCALGTVSPSQASATSPKITACDSA